MTARPQQSAAGETSVEERALVSRCRTGDENAFRDLVEKYRAPLCAYLIRYAQDQASAEDLLQETLIRVWRGLPKYEERGRFVSWLFQIARNVARDANRRRSRRPDVSYLELVPDVMSHTTPEAEQEARELEVVLTEAIAALPEKQRHVFLLRLHTDLRFREIAESTGEPLNTVLSHMHKAMSRLRTRVMAEIDV